MASIESPTEFQGRRLLRFQAAGTPCACDLDVVRGIMNLRGTMLTVVDLSLRLGGESRKLPRLVLVVEGAGKRFGLGVESVQGVADIAEGALEPVDAQRSAGGVIGALAHLGEPHGGTAQWCVVEAIAREALAT